MELLSTILTVTGIIFLIVILFLTVRLAMFSIKQGTVGVMLRFGKYKKICPSGLNFKIPGVDSIVIFTMQNQAAELSFQAITKDQANVYFKALVIYSTKDSTEDTIKKVAFTFASGDQFAQAMSKTIEGMVRSFIAGKNQQEVLGLRKEIIEYVQEHITSQLETWGYSLHDIQVNDISFDRVIMDSMAQVVASANLKAAATNEGDALMIKKTKTAEAEGNAIMIMARNEKDAEILRGQGVAGFREAIAEGMKVSLDKVGGEKGQEIAVQLISLSMWLDTFKNVAENGTGNFINFDGSPEGLQRFMQSNVVSAASAVSNKK